jgi:phage shock protein A
VRLFRRVGDIIAANLNDMVDRFEDPEVMLRQAIREMETMVERSTVGLARAVAAERPLSRELTDHERSALRWRAAADDAVAREDEDRARHAIAQAHEHETFAHSLAEPLSSAGETVRMVRSRLDAMNAKLAEARRILASLSARRRVVEVGWAMNETAFASPRSARGFARFELMRSRIEQTEAEAEALGELYAEARPDPDAEATSSERARRVEADLATIRERLRETRKR